MVKIFINKVSIGISLLALIWVFTDINNRFGANTLSKAQKADDFNAATFVLPQLDQKAKRALAETYERNRVKPTESQTQKKGISAQAREQQQGELTSFFVNDYKLQLKAVIADGQPNKASLTALLLVTNIRNGKKSIEKYTNNSQVHGYQMTIATSTQVTLVKDRVSGQAQIITLSMYQTGI